MEFLFFLVLWVILLINYISNRNRISLLEKRIRYLEKQEISHSALYREIKMEFDNNDLVNIDLNKLKEDI